jgi:type I restriction enzyme, S subunit
MVEKIRKAWTRVAFGDVVQLCRTRSSDPAEDGFDRYVGLEHLDPDDLKIRRWGNVADGTTFSSVFRAGQVLFGKRRAYQRKVAVADFDGVCSGDIYVLEPKNAHLLPDLLPFICQTDGFFDHAVGTSAGSLSPRTNWASLSNYEFPLPPLEEQRRIAGGLGVLFETIEDLHIALNQAEILRKCFLRNYFPFSSGSRPVVALGSLVDDGEVEFQTGPFGTILSASEYRESGWPIVNPTDMRNGEIFHKGGPCVDDATARRLETYRLCGGDILLARKGDFSKAVLIRQEHMGWIGGSYTIRLRCKSERLSPDYLYLNLQAPDAERMLYSYAHGTVMPGLNEKALGRLIIDLRSPTEQEVIVKKLYHLDLGERQLRARDRASRDLLKITLNQVLLCREDRP